MNYRLKRGFYSNEILDALKFDELVFICHKYIIQFV